MKYYKVAVNYPVNSGILTYQSQSIIPIGSLVKVPLGRREELGCVIEEVSDFKKEDQSYKLKDILAIEDDFILSESELKLYKWIAAYYHYSLGKLISDCLPKRLKRPRKIPQLIGKNTLNMTLSNPQQEIYKDISDKIFSGFSQHLIHGITGSGKSLIYLALMKEVLKDKKSILFLLPEINLTPQFMKMFEDYLSVPIYQFHSSVTNSEKYLLWKKLKESDETCVVVGVRSSVFLPMENLGLIIVDEEHDHSFKQEDRCPYHGRDVAIYKSYLHDIPIILGSATPAVETFHRFKNKTQKNTYYYSLTERYGEGKLPKIYISDLKELDDQEFFTEDSLKLLDECMANNEQALIFVNRLGFAHYFQCKKCGYHYECPNCSVNLKIYKKKQKMICHHCEYEKEIPKECHECGSLSFYHRGFGTEQVELKLKKLRPQITFDRFDRDEIKNFKDLKNKLHDFSEKKFDILIGTQMLSKGHNFKNVNLVIILGVDNQLNFPDFRSSEKIFQLVNQVAGRSGRFSDRGKVVIETLSDTSPLWHCLDTSKDDFYNGELGIREICACPPYYKLAVIYFSSRFQNRMIDFVSHESLALKKIAEKISGVILLGPKPAAIEKRVNKFTWLFMVKAKDAKSLNRFIESAKNYLRTPNGVSMKIDIDPMNVY